eukprot:3769418-Rhodomonas_salina.3
MATYHAGVEVRVVPAHQNVTTRTRLKPHAPVASLRPYSPLGVLDSIRIAESRAALTHGTAWTLGAFARVAAPRHAAVCGVARVGATGAPHALLRVDRGVDDQTTRRAVVQPQFRADEPVAAQAIGQLWWSLCHKTTLHQHVALGHAQFKAREECFAFKLSQQLLARQRWRGTPEAHRHITTGNQPSAPKILSDLHPDHLYLQQRVSDSLQYRICERVRVHVAPSGRRVECHDRRHGGRERHREVAVDTCHVFGASLELERTVRVGCNEHAWRRLLTLLLLIPSLVLHPESAGAPAPPIVASRGEPT